MVKNKIKTIKIVWLLLNVSLDGSFISLGDCLFLANLNMA